MGEMPGTSRLLMSSATGSEARERAACIDPPIGWKMHAARDRVMWEEDRSVTFPESPSRPPHICADPRALRHDPPASPRLPPEPPAVPHLPAVSATATAC